jgi:hypothetical protein
MKCHLVEFKEVHTRQVTVVAETKAEAIQLVRAEEFGHDLAVNFGMPYSVRVIETVNA